MVTRRLFLAAVGGTAAGSSLTAAAAAPAAGHYACFDAATAAFVAATCDCIIPSTPRSPGAIAAGIVRTLDRRLSGTWDDAANSSEDGWQTGGVLPRRPSALTPASYCLTAVHALEEWLAPGITFAALTPCAQRQLLEELHSAPIDLNGVPSNDFIELLSTLTIATYFSHERFGATRDRIHWPLTTHPGSHATISIALRI